MKLKFKLIFWAILLIATIFLIKLSSSPDSWINWHISTTKSELWAISQKLGNYSSSEPEFGTASLLSENSVDEGVIPSLNSAIATAEIVSSQPSVPYNFPLGWYDSITNLDTPAQIADQGMNLIMPYTGKHSVPEVKAYLDRAAAAGIMVMVEIPRIEVRRDHRWLITQFVKQLKNHPAVYGWYLFDEPEFTKMSPRILERVYRAIKAEDPQHPVAMAFGRLLYIRKYLKALDTVMYFKYPIMDNSPEFSGLENGTFSKLLNTATVIAQKPQDVWFILQGYGRDKYGRQTKFKRRLPTAAEARYMVYSGILAQADGLFFWTHYRSQQQWIDSVLRPIIQELKNYLPAIENETFNSRLGNEIAVDNSSIQARLYRNSTTQDLVLIAINHSNRKLNTAIAIKENIQVNSAQVLSAKGSIDIYEGLLQDIFEPYGVNIYQLK
ncbi:MAG: hypothetical protein AAF298_10530 [Cyanobacteria bacterium P01_A01_bin.40]